MIRGEDLLFVLSLDGGGAKGIYTLGVLQELEVILQSPIHKKFGLIYGSSTGAIIGALLSLGYSAEEVSNIYIDWIPRIFRHKRARRRTVELRACGMELLGAKGFDAFETLVGFVTTDCTHERPRIFKNASGQAFSRRESFEPGFGASIVDSLVASAAAVPFFERVTVQTKNQGDPVLMDGGFVANNPSLYALTDAKGSLGFADERIRLLSVGTGHFTNPPRGAKDSFLRWMIDGFFPSDVFEKSLAANAKSVDWLTSALFPDVQKLRIDDVCPEITLGILSKNKQALRAAQTCGRDSFGKVEEHAKALLGLT